MNLVSFGPCGSETCLLACGQREEEEVRRRCASIMYSDPLFWDKAGATGKTKPDCSKKSFPVVSCRWRRCCNKGSLSSWLYLARYSPHLPLPPFFVHPRSTEPYSSFHLTFPSANKTHHASAETDPCCQYYPQKTCTHWVSTFYIDYMVKQSVLPEITHSVPVQPFVSFKS